MTQSEKFYTQTMAKLYADQGYLRKAAEIYHHLLAQSPEREDLRQALAAVEARIGRQQTPTAKELRLMFREWVDLMAQYNSKKRQREKQQRREDERDDEKV